MKLLNVVVLVSAGTAPFVAAVGVEWLTAGDVERILDGENVTRVAAEIAQREFSAGAAIEVLETWDAPWTTAEWGDRLKADDDHVYRHVRIRITNEGKLDAAVHTSHFHALDDVGRRIRAEWGLAHRIDNPALEAGASGVGVLVFHVPDYAQLDRIEYRGSFASASTAAAPASPAPAAAPSSAALPSDAPPRESTPEGREHEADADKYASHWDR